MENAPQPMEVINGCYQKNSMLVLDSRKKIKYFNPAFLAMLGQVPPPLETKVDALFSIDLDGIFTHRAEGSDAWRAFCAYDKKGNAYDGWVLHESNDYILIFENMPAQERQQALLDALNLAAAQMHNIQDAKDIYLASAQVLKQSGFESMLLLLDGKTDRLSGMYHSFGKANLNMLERVDAPGDHFTAQPGVHETIIKTIKRGEPAIVDKTKDFLERVFPTCFNGIPIKIASQLKVLKSIAAPMDINGQVAGIFFVLSKDINGGDKPAVTAFANQLAAAIEKAQLIQSLKVNIDKLKESHDEYKDILERLRIATQAGKVGIWEADLVHNKLYWDDMMYRLFQVFPKRSEITFELWKKVLHPEDVSSVESLLKKALNENTAFDAEFRIVWPDGNVRYIKAHAIMHNDDIGNAVRILGTSWDITDRKNVERDLHKREKLLRKIFNTLPIGLWYSDKDGKLLEANPAAKTIWGEVRLDEMEDYSVFKVRRYPSGKTVDVKDSALMQTIKHGNTVTDEMLEIDTFDGRKRIILNYTAPVMGDSGELDGAIVINQDITHRKKAEEALVKEKELLHTTLQSIGDGVIVTDEQGNITIINTVFERFSGWTQQEAVGKRFDEVVQIIGEKSRKKSRNIVKRVLQTGEISAISSNHILVCKDGREIPVANSAAPIKNSQGDVLGAVLVLRDVTEEIKKRKKINYLVHHDSLTGLYNRRFFEHQLSKLDTKENLPLSIISCDVNGLKLTNDAFGHSVGDQLLKKMASTIKKACRLDDIIVRSGGDEFFILLPNTDSHQAQAVLERIKMLVSKVDMGVVEFSLSVGFETKSQIDVDIESTLKKAEDNMYRNKFFSGSSMKDMSINTILTTLHKKSPKEKMHSYRVSELCRQIGRAMRLTTAEVDELGMIGLMHDIGKIAIDDAVLNKNSVLTEEEKAEKRRHPEIGFRILRASSEMARVADYVLAHHERYDGQGYPKGLCREQIPMLSRILSVADVFVDLVSDSPRKSAISKDVAMADIISKSGTCFDPKVVKALECLFEKDHL